MTPEDRRQRVLEMLEQRPGLRFAWVSDGKPDHCGMVPIAIAIRDQSAGIVTAELAIDADRYDALSLLEIIHTTTEAPCPS